MLRHEVLTYILTRCLCPSFLALRRRMTSSNAFTCFLQESTAQYVPSLETKELPKKKRKTWKKPADKPKRPPSAYNLYFQLERERLLANEPDREFTAEEVARIAETQVLGLKPKRKHRKSHGKISFAELARVIANKWKELESSRKTVFERRAAYEKQRYVKAVEEWAAEKKRQHQKSVVNENNTASLQTHHKSVEDPVALSIHASSLQQSMKAFLQNIDHEEQLHPVEDDAFSFPDQHPFMCQKACSVADQVFQMALQCNIQPDYQQPNEVHSQFMTQDNFSFQPQHQAQHLSDQYSYNSTGDNCGMMQHRIVSDLSDVQSSHHVQHVDSKVNATFQQYSEFNHMDQHQHQHMSQTEVEPIRVLYQGNINGSHDMANFHFLQ